MVYAVTTDNRLLGFRSPTDEHSMWLRSAGARWKIYYKNCTCANCTRADHEVLIAYVESSRVVSIGFERPVAVEGRMLTSSERYALGNLRDWLKAVKRLPKKIRDIVPAIESLIALAEKK